jgi:RNA polymerase subunit RPABC4/transcription elongation factor Spt4
MPYKNLTDHGIRRCTTCDFLQPIEKEICQRCGDILTEQNNPFGTIHDVIKKQH